MRRRTSLALALGILSGCGDASGMDAIYARRMIGPSVIEPPVFQTPSFTTHYSGTLKYWKTIEGSVRFGGAVVYDGNPAGQGVAAFTLPAGYTPSVFSVYLLPTAAGGSVMGSVATGGDVIFDMGTATPFTAYASVIDFQL